MKTIRITRKEFNFYEYVKRKAEISDFETLITDEVLVTENGQPKILYAKLPDEKTKFIRQACKNIKYETNTRTTGLKTRSRIFGYNPRNTIRKDFCSSTSLAIESPTEHQIICDFGEYLSELYLKYFPDVYKAHNDIVKEKMLDEWKINNTPFTSGIVNKNN